MKLGVCVNLRLGDPGSSIFEDVLVAFVGRKINSSHGRGFSGGDRTTRARAIGKRFGDGCASRRSHPTSRKRLRMSAAERRER